MTTIVVGYFNEINDLEAAKNSLLNEGLTSSDMAYYYLNPPGAHGLYKLGGDSFNDEGADEAGKTAATGAAVGGAAGLAVGSIGGPIGALAGAGAGAYIGALMGALRNLEDPDPEDATVEHPAEPPSGPLLAVRVLQPDQKTHFLDVFRTFGAVRVDLTTGQWEDGNWTDFDPRGQVLTLYRKDETVP
ncbi:MAG TPA: hypothetical protein VKY38_03800 [Azoarcus sp.]|nr:hypothetical protein [Azoarcus sp.]